MNQKTQGRLMLLLATLIWGTSLVAQSVGMEHIDPFTFNAARFLIGASILLPFIIIPSMYHKREPQSSITPEKTPKLLIKGGICCGCIVFITASLQQIGICYTTVGKAGFITALYIVIVPVLGLFWGNHITWHMWSSIFIALFGMYLLCMNESFTLTLGDTLVLFCALSTAVHILLIDHFSPHVDGIKLSCIQFFTCGLLSLISAFIFENPNWNSIIYASMPILYTGILSCGIAYTLQTLGQKYVTPIIACLILSLESVFSVLSGWLMLGEILSLKQIVGCILMFSAILISQFSDLYNKKT